MQLLEAEDVARHPAAHHELHNAPSKTSWILRVAGSTLLGFIRVIVRPMASNASGGAGSRAERRRVRFAGSGPTLGAFFQAVSG